MKETLQELLKDRLCRDILLFFSENQASVDSAGGISAWVGDTRENVSAALEKLVEAGVLNKDSEGGTKGYCYTRDEKTMQIVEELLKSDAGS